MSIDPKANEFPFNSPYSYAANSPISYIDKNGENPILAIYAAELVFAAAAMVTTAIVLHDMQQKGMFRNMTLPEFQAGYEVEIFPSDDGTDKSWYQVLPRTVETGMWVEGFDEVVLEQQMEQVLPTASDGLQMEIFPALEQAVGFTILAASGPMAGAIEVSANVPSVGQFTNYAPNGDIEFVYDHVNGRFVVGRDKDGIMPAGLSPHEKLARSIGSTLYNDPNIVGGHFKRDDNGNILPMKTPDIITKTGRMKLEQSSRNL